MLGAFEERKAEERNVIGETISHYTVVEKLGGGGMGVVYRGEDTKLHRHVALKFLPDEMTDDRQSVERFMREARAAAALEHPNICGIHDIGDHEGRPFIVMELMRGSTLKQVIRRGPMKIEDVLELGEQLADALDAAHQAGIVHRDIKPANIFVTDRGQAKILDFGLAKLTPSGSAASDTPADVTETASENEQLTSPGSAIGTVAYMSPEQARGQDVDARSDLFSLGVVLYEMVTGRPAFPGSTSAVIFDAIFHDTPTAAVRLNPEVPGDLEQIISKSLVKDRELRYQHASGLRSDLKRLSKEGDSGRSSASNVPRAVVPRSNSAKPIIAGAGAVILVVALGVWQFVGSRNSLLDETDVILLADFVNTTGDDDFDGTLEAALALRFDESPFLNILPGRRVQEILGQMGRESDERITPSIGEEVCTRVGLKAMITGEIASLGSNYIVTLNAVNCGTGEVLAREQVESATKEEVLRALGEAATNMRGNLGESIRTIEELNARLEEVTTTSLEALKAFSLAPGFQVDAIPFYTRAIELDPNFAEAHSRLAATYANISEYEIAIESAIRSFELRDRVSEGERFAVLTRYHQHVTGDFGAELDTLGQWIETYPREPRAYNLRSITLRRVGQFEGSRDAAIESMRLDPTSGNPYSNLVGAHIGLLQFEDAKRVGEEGIAAGLDNYFLRARLYRIASIEGDADQAARHLEWANGRPTEYRFLAAQAGTAVFAGKLGEARDLYGRAVTLAARGPSAENPARIMAEQAWIEALVGNTAAAVEKANESLDTHPGRSVRMTAVLALALGGATEQAEAVLAELTDQGPEHLGLNAVTSPTVRAIIALDSGSPDEAVGELQSATAYERSNLGPTYFRGLAHLALGEGAEAAQSFQQVLDNRGAALARLRTSSAPFGGFPFQLAHVGLARAHVLQGNVDLARESYDTFFKLWTDADPDVTILEEARSEYSQLLN